MVTNVVVLTQHDISLPGEVLAHQLYEVGDYRFHLRGAQCSPVHVLLCLSEARSDYAWLKTHAKEYLTCPVKVVLSAYGPNSLLGSLLAREIQGIEVVETLGVEFVEGKLTQLLRRLEEIYAQCFDLLDGKKRGSVTSEDLRAAAEKYQKSMNEEQISAALCETSGREAASNFTKSEFITWWKNGRPTSGFLLVEILNQILQTTPILHMSGTDLRRMILASDTEDLEQSFSSVVTFGEVSESPNVTLNCKVDAKAEDSKKLSLTITLSVRESLDVSAAKSALETSVSALLDTIKPYDTNGAIIPLLNFSFSMAHRKVVMTLNLSTDEGVFAKLAAKFRGVFGPLLQCPFTQFIEINASSDLALAQMAEDGERSFLEWLSEGTELQVDIFYWNFYTDLLNLILSPNNESDLFITMILSALKDGALELEFGSVSELPSFVLAAIHNSLRRFGSLSLCKLRQLLRNSTHEIMVSVKSVLSVLSSKFDSQSIGLRAEALNFSVNGELSATDLFDVFVV